MAPLLVLALALGCSDGERPPSRPPTGPGGGGGTQPPPAVADAGPAGDAQAAQQITGFLCPVTDLRSPGACADRDLSGTRVTERVGGATTTTDASGSFAVPSPDAQVAVLAAGFEDPSLRASLSEVFLEGGAAEDVIASVIPQATYDSLTAALAVQEPNGTASLALYVRDGGAPVEGAEVVPPDGTMIAPYYDTALGPESWDQEGLTGPAGAALVFAVPTGVGPVTFTVVGPGGDPVVTVSDVPVEAEATTFVFIELGGSSS